MGHIFGISFFAFDVAAEYISYIPLKNPRWPEFASELYRPSDRRLLAKLVPTFADRGCRVVSATDPYGRILGFLDRSRYFFLLRVIFVLNYK
jgi:hypothetical protein